MTEKTEISWIRIVILTLFAALAAGAIVIGGMFYFMGIDQWIDGSYSFSGLAMIVWTVGLVGAGAMISGMIVIGVVLRFLRWERAPLLSLVLAIISTLFILATYEFYTSLDGALAPIEIFVVQVLAFICLFVMPLPPFLHWLRAGRRPALKIAAETKAPEAGS